MLLDTSTTMRMNAIDTPYTPYDSAMIMQPGGVGGRGGKMDGGLVPDRAGEGTSAIG